MPTNLAINGFGRIGRLVLRTLLERYKTDLVDLVVDLKKSSTVENINEAFHQAAQGAMKGVLVFCGEPLVSSDFRGNPASSIVDGLSKKGL